MAQPTIPTIQEDAYKEFHAHAYHPDVTEVYGNFTNRSGKYAPDNLLGGVVNVGLQYYIKDFLIEEFGQFFDAPKDTAIAVHAAVISSVLGTANTQRWEELHDLGYLPLEIKQLPEGMIVPYGVPSITVRSTKEGFQWLTNALETVMSSEIWGIQTSATTAANFKLRALRMAKATGVPLEAVNYLCHDFSFRGMFGRQAAAMSGFGHATSFLGSDTIPVVPFAVKYYNAQIDEDIIKSVNATEHSVTCSWQNEGEIAFYRHLMNNVSPTGILSLVFDTWDFWGGVTKILPELKEEIMNRDGQVVIRPDSGDPVEILCGAKLNDITMKVLKYADKDLTKEELVQYAKEWMVEDIDENFRDELADDPTNPFCTLTKSYTFDGVTYEVTYEPDLNRHDKTYYYVDNYCDDIEKCTFKEVEITPERKGLIECLWEIFGGTVNEHGYKVLDSHIGAIYGDSITLERQDEIYKRLMAKGFAPTVVLGVGSYSYQHVTRDTHGSAVKATSVVKNGNREAIFKAPKTDASKASAKGLLKVTFAEQGKLVVEDDVSFEEEQSNDNLLTTVFLDGQLVSDQSLQDIRKLVDYQLRILSENI